MLVKSDIVRLLPFDRYVFQKNQSSCVFSDSSAEIKPLSEEFSGESLSGYLFCKPLVRVFCLEIFRNLREP